MSQSTCRIKNIKTNTYVGRSLYEDGSDIPKSFFPLKPEEVGENAVFDIFRGINPLLWEFHSLKSEVARAEIIGFPGIQARPAAFVVDYVDRFWWEHDHEKGGDV